MEEACLMWAAHELMQGWEPVYSAYGYGLYNCSEEKVELNPDLALLLTTSGSTGSPKLVRLSYRNIRSNAESIADYLNIDEHVRMLRPILTLLAASR